MKKLLILTCFVLFSFNAQATVLTFDNGSSLSGWYTDRFEPDSFQIVDNKLEIGISGLDQQSDSFYNYQGKKHDFGDNIYTHSIVGDLYVDSIWANNMDANVGMWGTGKDSNGDVSSYPIFAFRNGSSVDAGFYGFDYKNGGWFDVFTPGDFSFDYWYSLKMQFTSDSLDYYLNGNKVYSFSDTHLQDNISNIILNSYNFGKDYTVTWDNVGTQPVPEPTTMLLFGTGLLGLIGFGRKKFFNKT